MTKLCGLAVFSLGFLVALGNGQTREHPTYGMDEPLNTKILDLGPSPYYPGRDRPITLSCYFYPSIVVKEYDAGQKGAEWLSFLRFDGGKTPSCNESHAPGEKVIPDGGEWSGYFDGVKGNFIFFIAADGTDGGMPFVVFDSVSSKKVFEDSAYVSWNESTKAEGAPFDHMRVSTTPNGTVILRYLRVTEAGCDLQANRDSCWEQVRKKLDLKSTPAPICSGYDKDLNALDSALGYPVEVSLTAEPKIAPIAARAHCWPVE